MVLLLGACLLCAPAFYNGYPLLFPDLLDYVVDGMNLVRKRWPVGTRPPYYGVAIWPLHLETSLWPVVIAQGLVVCHLLSTVLRAVGVPLRGPAFLALIAGLAVFTSLPWYVSHVMPDLFGGVLILSLFLLAFCTERLSILEKVYFSLLSVLCFVFHLSFLPVSLGVLAVAIGFRLLRRRDAGAPRPVFALVPILLALGVSAYVSHRLWGNLSVAPYAPPYLLAHVLVDAPGKTYLQRTCERENYALCQRLDSIPNDVEEFMFGQHSPSREFGEQQRIRNEASAIVIGTAKMFPLETLGVALKAGAAQIVTFHTEVVQLEDLPYANGDSLGDMFVDQLPFIGRGYQNTRQYMGLLSPVGLSWMNALHRMVVALSALFSLYAVVRCIKTRDWGFVQLLAVVCAGVLINGLTTGAAVGVFGRFGARVIWLVPFAAVAVGLFMARAPRRTPSSAHLSELPSPGLSN